MNKRCETCPRNTACIRYILSKSVPEIIAWCKDAKKILHLTNSIISTDTNIPKSTVDRVFAEKSDLSDIRMATLLPIVWYLAEKLGIAECDPQEHPDQKEIDRLNALVVDLRATIKQQQEDAKTAREDLREEVGTLKKMNRNKAIALTVVAILLFVSLAVIIIALIIDRMDPTRGFLWLSQVFHTGHNVADIFNQL